MAPKEYPVPIPLRLNTRFRTAAPVSFSFPTPDRLIFCTYHMVLRRHRQTDPIEPGFLFTSSRFLRLNQAQLTLPTVPGSFLVPLRRLRHGD